MQPPPLSRGGASGSRAAKLTPIRSGWSCRFWPTPFRSLTTGTSRRFNSAASPMPDIIRRRGVSIAPAQRMTSCAARVARGTALDKMRHRHATAGLKTKLRHQRIGKDGQIGPPHDRTEIAARRAPAHAVDGVEIGKASSFVARSVHVVDDRNAERGGGFDAWRAAIGCGSRGRSIRSGPPAPRKSKSRRPPNPRRV